MLKHKLNAYKEDNQIHRQSTYYLYTSAQSFNQNQR